MPTEILFILDLSGSMASMRQAAIGGFNRFFAGQPEPQAARLLMFFRPSSPHFPAP